MIYRRITVLQPDASASWTLKSQPFPRRIVSACLGNYQTDVVSSAEPLLRVADVSGNLVFFSNIQPLITNGSNMVLWSVNGSVISGATGAGQFYSTAPLPPDLWCPQSYLFTISTQNPAAGDLPGNLVLVTEDEWPADWPQF